MLGTVKFDGKVLQGPIEGSLGSAGVWRVACPLQFSGSALRSCSQDGRSHRGEVNRQVFIEYRLALLYVPGCCSSNSLSCVKDQRG